MNARLAILLLLIIGLTWSGCKKYEEGPVFSLKTKKARIVNKWQYEYYEEYAICVALPPDPCPIEYFDVTEDRSQFYIEFNDDNTFIDIKMYDSWTEPKTYEGTWQLIDNKERIKMCYDGACDTYKWKIIRLKEKEMWIEEYLDDFLWSTRRLKPL